MRSGAQIICYPTNSSEQEILIDIKIVHSNLFYIHLVNIKIVNIMVHQATELIFMNTSQVLLVVVVLFFFFSFSLLSSHLKHREYDPHAKTWNHTAVRHILIMRDIDVCKSPR